MKIKEVLDNPEFQKEYRRTKPAVRTAALAVGNVVAQMIKEQRRFPQPGLQQAYIGALTFTELRSLVGRTVASYLQYPDQLGFVDFAHIISEYNGLHVFHGSTPKESVLWFMEESGIVPTIDLQLADVKRLYAAINDNTVNLDLGTYDSIDREPKSNSPLIGLTASTLKDSAASTPMEDAAIMLLQRLVSMDQATITLAEFKHHLGPNDDVDSVFAIMDSMLPTVVNGHRIERKRLMQKSKGSAMPAYKVSRIRAPLTPEQLTKLTAAAFTHLDGVPFTVAHLMKVVGIDMAGVHSHHSTFGAHVPSLVYMGRQIAPFDSQLFRSSGVELTAKANRQLSFVMIPEPAGPRLTAAQVRWLVGAAYKLTKGSIDLRKLKQELETISSPEEALLLRQVPFATCVQQFDEAIKHERRGDYNTMICKQRNRTDQYRLEADDEDEDWDDDDEDDGFPDTRGAPSRGKLPKPAAKTAKPAKGSKRPQASSFDDEDEDDM